MQTFYLEQPVWSPPLAKSILITQMSRMPTIPAVLPHVGDILEPSSNRKARAAYLERQMKDMGSVRLPSDIPSLEDGVSLGPESLPKRIQNFVRRKGIKGSMNGNLIE